MQTPDHAGRRPRPTLPLAAALLLTSTGLFAQEASEELPPATAEVTLEFVSNYIDRGEDKFANRARQEGRSFGSNTGEWAVQPEIKFLTPVDGLYFGMWGSFALGHRRDQDTDQVLQTGPEQSDLLASAYDLEAQITAVRNALGTDPATIINRALVTNSEGTTGLPQYYKELNGLRRVDRVDFFIGYEQETNLGNFGFGLNFETAANSRRKGTVTTADQPAEEISFSYAPPFFTDLSYEIIADLDQNNYYHLISYAPSFEITENLAIEPGLAAGYAQGAPGKKIMGWQDVVGSLGVSAYGFSVTMNACYRPNLRFFDTDTTSLQAAHWLNGGSSSNDGLVADPARTYGVANAAFNSALSGYLSDNSTFGRDATGKPNYTYTPRQKLPRVVTWLSVAYSFTL